MVQIVLISCKHCIQCVAILMQIVPIIIILSWIYCSWWLAYCNLFFFFFLLFSLFFLSKKKSYRQEWISNHNKQSHNFVRTAIFWKKKTLFQIEGVNIISPFFAPAWERQRWKAIYRSMHHNRSMDQPLLWLWQWPVKVFQKEI